MYCFALISHVLVMFGLKFFVLIINTDSSDHNLLTLIALNAGEAKSQTYSI
jgi:hypothetical protein